jgi:hypothetical protein
MKQKNSIERNITQTWTAKGLVGTYDDVPIQDVINKLQLLIDDGYTHVRGEPKIMYYEPDEDSLENEVVDEIIFSKK